MSLRNRFEFPFKSFYQYLPSLFRSFFICFHSSHRPQCSSLKIVEILKNNSRTGVKIKSVAACPFKSNFFMKLSLGLPSSLIFPFSTSEKEKLRSASSLPSSFLFSGFSQENGDRFVLQGGQHSLSLVKGQLLQPVLQGLASHHPSAQLRHRTVSFRLRKILLRQCSYVNCFHCFVIHFSSVIRDKKTTP